VEGATRATPTDQPVSPDSGNSGPRKLVRPTLPPRALRDAGHNMRTESPLLAHHTALPSVLADEASHAEAFYFQKQMQMQTLMTFVLEDGDQIEGYIEWYDRHAIKVRNGSRTLIYKSSIKYLYKTGENSG
jgi:sRNA-binding regulator protein Hfq